MSKSCIKLGGCLNLRSPEFRKGDVKLTAKAPEKLMLGRRITFLLGRLGLFFRGEPWLVSGSVDPKKGIPHPLASQTPRLVAGNCAPWRIQRIISSAGWSSGVSIGCAKLLFRQFFVPNDQKPFQCNNP